MLETLIISSNHCVTERTTERPNVRDGGINLNLEISQKRKADAEREKSAKKYANYNAIRWPARSKSKNDSTGASKKGRKTKKGSGLQAGNITVEDCTAPAKNDTILTKGTAYLTRTLQSFWPKTSTAVSGRRWKWLLRVIENLTRITTQLLNVHQRAKKTTSKLIVRWR